METLTLNIKKAFAQELSLRSKQLKERYWGSSQAIEFEHTIEQLVKEKNWINLALLLRTMTSNSLWLSYKALKLFKNYIPLAAGQSSRQNTSLLRNVGQNIIARPRTISHYSDPIAFQGLYRFFRLAHKKRSVPKIDFKKDNLSILLVPGVLNELFSNASFERSIRYLSQKYEIPYNVIGVNGFRGCHYNKDLIIESIKAAQKKFPGKKLWIIGFSKGGVDSLHALRELEDPSQIWGLSCIASPICGLDSTNSTLFKIFKTLEHTFVSGKNSRSTAREIEQSLSRKIQSEWLRENMPYLPQNIFYSSVGFETNLLENHLWMMILKSFIKYDAPNDGVVDIHSLKIPQDLSPYNLGTINGHHLVGSQSSLFEQEAFIESLFSFLVFKSKR